MKLEQLMEGVPYTLVQGSPETEINDIIYDSRKAAPGLLFVCIVGTQRDSHEFAAACAALSATFNADAARERALLDGAVSRLSELDGLVVNGAHDAPHILSLSVPGVPTQNTINILQDHGICVSAGSACAKGHRSHVLEAMGLSPEIIDGSFRVSLCRDTTAEELDALVSVIREEILPRAR